MSEFNTPDDPQARALFDGLVEQMDQTKSEVPSAEEQRETLSLLQREHLAEWAKSGLLRRAFNGEYYDPESSENKLVLHSYMRPRLSDGKVVEELAIYKIERTSNTVLTQPVAVVGEVYENEVMPPFPNAHEFTIEDAELVFRQAQDLRRFKDMGILPNITEGLVHIL